MAPLTIAKFVGLGLLVALVVGGAFMLRHELIEKGMNIVYAQNNAAIVKAQAEQENRDRATINQQRKYIERLEESGVKVVERIKNVPAPCIGDGRNDPRLDDVSDWVRDSLTPRPGSAKGGPTP